MHACDYQTATVSLLYCLKVQLLKLYDGPTIDRGSAVLAVLLYATAVAFFGC